VRTVSNRCYIMRIRYLERSLRLSLRGTKLCIKRSSEEAVSVLRAGSSPVAPLSWICGIIGITARYLHLLCSHSLAVVSRMLA